MAYTNIDKSSLHFNTVTYTGNGSTQSITGVGFQPDWLWVKRRDSADHHCLEDAIRGAGYSVRTSGTDAQQYRNNDITSFNSDGFSLGSSGETNINSGTFVSWNWKANGQGSSNTDGSINTTYTSVNTTAGFSISQWNGDGSSSATVGHGLGVIPKVIISKAISASAPEGGWFVMHSSLPDAENLRLNQTHGQYSTSQFSQGLIKESATTNQVFGFQAGSGVENVNSNGHTYITYCFAEKTGYSKFGKYTGNGNADGTFIFTGFKPSWFMLKKNSSGGADSWYIFDNKRSPINAVDDFVTADATGAEGGDGNSYLDFLSNGIKHKTTSFNVDGETYIYMAFGQSLVGSNNVPCTAR